MKSITYIITLFIAFSGSMIFAQTIDYNLDGGFVAEGYDVVSYFSNTPTKGKKEFVLEYQELKLKFSTQENLDLFKSNPDKYLPQYGGWCAYAMGLKGEKVNINPKSYEIRDDKLYLFYNAWGVNTLKMWLDEKPKELQQKANLEWEKIKYQ